MNSEGYILYVFFDVVVNWAACLYRGELHPKPLKSASVIRVNNQTAYEHGEERTIINTALDFTTTAISTNQ